MIEFEDTSVAREAPDPLSFALGWREFDTPRMVTAAIAAGNCALTYQPVKRREDEATAFYEGLIRLKDHSGRLLPAAAFIDAVEETEIGRDLDTLALRLAFDMLRENGGMRLSVNVSARSLGDRAWRRTLEDNLSSHPMLGERLILELTERSAMLLPELVLRFMEEMQPRGVAFALDEFGSGATSFRHLKRFYFDLVKLDRSFTANIHRDADNQVMVQALLSIAHQFDMFAVATGVEKEEEAGWLRSAGMDCLQGYWIGTPRFSL
ncbi:EAL domain-containing protein [Pelagovum pacificum]|uniref:EAL domain-containing protein n=1 Tax=Pelagovum pacificum TaxID=2588711 RepID=A0A5C5GCD5_9RHOB|nr:EAL domain-containing protein [Pelagovum pacificum]QQA42556.1 EAL domain-containing protein [Pelagovum pacificum]TNY31640.1 EAL domain-containing protein [Pelagovum pacificum]